MTTSERDPPRDAPPDAWSEVLQRRFEAIAFDWDGTAVSDRRADALPVRRQIEQLVSFGVEVGVTSGTHVENIDGQLQARPAGPGHLYLCVNRGSEIYEANSTGVHLIHRRSASTAEELALDRAAERTAEALQEHGLTPVPITRRFNRRKLDLIATPDWADPPKARIAELVDAVSARIRASGLGSLAAVVELATGAARDAGLEDPRVTTDGKFVEIGLTDKSESLRWLMAKWWGSGIGPGLTVIAGDEMGSLGGVRGSDHYMVVPEAQRASVLSVGVEPEGVPQEVVHIGGGPRAFLTFLADQTARHQTHELPGIDIDPLWSITVLGADHTLERVNQVLLTLASGTLGSGGAPCLRHPTVTPTVFVAGAFEGRGEESHLLRCPIWQESSARLPTDAEVRRVLDLHTGLLRQDVIDAHRSVRALGLAAVHRAGVAALAVAGLDVDESPALVSYRHPTKADARTRVLDHPGDQQLDCEGGSVTVSATTRVFVSPTGPRTDLVARYVRHEDGIEPPAPEHVDVDSLVREHRAAWAARWRQADVVIRGDDELQRAVRFALFHLMSQAPDDEEAFVGARGLTGEGYRGHVFWDADVFVLPFLALTNPPAARAMLEYRIRRLPQARARAAAFDKAGARFPWESAATGEDVTPARMRDQTGREILIHTGTYEEHIVADVAWAACFYADWTGETQFMAGPGGELVVETARYWSSRCRRDNDGRMHIDAVIGPDEYHEIVNDNAFTNVMARWNLRRALRLHDEGLVQIDDQEREVWRNVAANLVDGYDPGTQLFEQFSGFYALAPFDLARAVPHRPVAADLLVGYDVVNRSQIVKQADVLMLHHMVPEEVPAGSLAPNFAYYEPRTAHGSSLSPGVHAGLLARLGRPDEALDLLRLVGRLDLDDVTGTTAGGLHLAAMGSLWQALAFGVAGLQLTADGVALDPHVPAIWTEFALPVQVRGNLVRITIHGDRLDVAAAAPLTVSLPAGITMHAAPGQPAAAQREEDGRWVVVPPPSR
ncbi:MAG: glycosyl hydrolase family 65 protein [Candidatus Dormiibacterota bacterium]